MEFEILSDDVLIVLIVFDFRGLSVGQVVFDSVRFLCLSDQFLDESQVPLMYRQYLAAILYLKGMAGLTRSPEKAMPS